jgi:hypothetical protein
MPEPSNIRFPAKKTELSLGSLSLRRNRSVTSSPFSVSEATAAARESIRAIVSATRPPMGGHGGATEDARIAELAEAAPLLAAREQLVAASRKSTASHVSPEEKIALEGLRAELERQEGALKEAQAALHEREQFMEDSETRLFEKVQNQQEREIELDQREEELRSRIRKNREREAAMDPQAAAALKAEDAAAADSDEMRA